jgi:hypothetical protein
VRPRRTTKAKKRTGKALLCVFYRVAQQRTNGRFLHGKLALRCAFSNHAWRKIIVVRHSRRKANKNDSRSPRCKCVGRGLSASSGVAPSSGRHTSNNKKNGLVPYILLIPLFCIFTRDMCLMNTWWSII